MPKPDPRRVVALAYDGLCTFELGIVVEVFGLARPELSIPWYRFAVCALERRSLRATGGITVRATGGLRELERAGTIIVPGWRNPEERPPAAVLRALRSAFARGARVVSICSGVFVLAAAGLLDGRRVTTHWRYLETLRRLHPGLRIEPDVLFVDEGRVMTSAGSAAGIDLCLHLVRLDHGAEIANQVARRLVVPPQREGGQAQYVPVPAAAAPRVGLSGLLAWALGRLGDDLTVERLAKRAAMSPRTFARQFREQTGTTPHRWLTHQRLMAAQRRLESGAESVDRVAEAVGFQTGATLRMHFRRAFRTTPTAYRRRFSKVPPRPGKRA